MPESVADPTLRLPDDPFAGSARPKPFEAIRSGGDPVRLVAASALMLFVELALIRWTAANNVHLAYVTNFVLIASFLGVGLGFLLSRSRHDIFASVPFWLALLVAFVLAFPVRLVALAGQHELQGAAGMHALPQWLSLSVIFVLVVLTMAGLGQGVARVFGRFRPLDAYRFDIIGSLGGIALFSVLSFLGLPPIAWGATACAGLVVLAKKLRWWQLPLIAAIIVMLTIESMSANDHWSPYYKITAVQPPGARGTLIVSANNIPHQTAYPLATLHRIESFYFFPYRHVSRNRLDNVLVIGAGTGNDVAVALSEGAKHVDAVEIDPELAKLGKQYNIDRPYQDPRVSLHIDDGRAYLERTASKYDLVLFALPDSLTVLAGQSSLRLENYLLTQESMEAVRSHLKRGGVFSMYNYYQPFLLDRYASTLRNVYGASPCLEVGDPLGGRRQAVLTVSESGSASGCRTPWHGRTVAAATDDHPFPYLPPSPTLPNIYIWTIGLILAASALAIRVVGGPLRPMAGYLDLFCMGGAFLLLETKNIVQYALLFGTTWFVNSLVFAGVLLTVYLAVEVARRFTLPPRRLLYAALFATLFVAWVVPQEDLLALSPMPRFAAATAIAFAPVFIANLVFSQRFKDVASSTTAFAANLLGAIVGGLLEYLSLVTGYRFLLVVVALLYAMAFALGTRTHTRVPNATMAD
jgi:Spermine/spermidine synthase domain